MSLQKETLVKHPREKRRPSLTSNDLDSCDEPKNNVKRRRNNIPTSEPGVTSARHPDTSYDKSILSTLTPSLSTSETRDKKLIVTIDGGKTDGYDHSAFRRRTRARSTILADWLKTGEQCTVLLRSFLFRLTVLV